MFKYPEVVMVFRLSLSLSLYFCGLLKLLKWRYSFPASTCKSIYNMHVFLCFLPQIYSTLSSRDPQNTSTNPFKELPVASLIFFQILIARGTLFFCIPVVFMADIFR